MTEDDLLKTVLDMCKQFRLKTAHFRPAKTQAGNWVTAVQGDGKGFPDLVIVGPGGVLFRELKSDIGRLSPEQKMWMYKLNEAGADFGRWRPADLHSGRIERELRALRNPHPQLPRNPLSAIPQT